MKKFKTFLSLILVVSILAANLVVPVHAGVSTNYTLTGNQANDVIAVAKAQLGKTKSDFGWTVDWCAYFVCWAGQTAKAKFPSPTSAGNGRALTAWFVNNSAGTFYYFRDANYTNLINNEKISNKGLCVKSSRSSFVPKKGDIVLYLWSEDVGQYNWSHVGLVESYSNNTLKTVEGNTSGGVVANRSRAYDSQVIGIIRPNYKTTSTTTSTTQLGGTTLTLKTGVYYNLINKASGKYLNVYGSSSGNNVNVDVYAKDGTTGEKFKLTKVNSWYTLTPACATSYRVNVYGTVSKNDSNVCLWKDSQNDTQGWLFEAVKGGYIIRSANNKNLVLTATGTSNSSNVKIATYSAGNNYQIWDFKAT